MENDGKVIALLIDAENVSPKYIKTIIDEVSMIIVKLLIHHFNIKSISILS